MKKKRIIIALFFILMTITIIFRLNLGSDYFWHIKVGEHIINFKELPKTCIYSWYAIENNLMFTLHEWLYEVIVYLLSLISKIFAPLLYMIITMGILNFFIYKTNINKIMKKNLTYFIPFIALATICLSLYSLPRPHIISWLLVAITVYLSYDLYTNDSKKIYLLPVITIIWGNIHGGSSCLSYMIPGLFMVLGLFNFNKFFITNNKLPKEKIIRYIIIIILNMLALLINPYNIEMILYPYINMLDDTMKSIINEWKPLSLKSSIGIVSYIFIFYNLYIYYRGKQKIKLIDLSLFLVFTYLAITSYRFVPLLVIISFYTTLNYLDYSNKGFKGNSLIITLGITLLLLIITQVKPLYTILNDKEIDDSLIRTIKEINPQRLYNDYNIGGYLIYNDIDVSIDGRADAYSKDNLKDFTSLMIGDGKDTKEILDNYNFDLLITLTNSYLGDYLEKSNEYEFIIKDEYYSIYKKITQ